jgi:transcriptional regulator with XRE-family HTH domain
MKERLLEFLRTENKSSAQLAEEIGVQPSGISHILSGRNNPSLDFVLKMLEKYQSLSSDWLLFGKGSMYKEAKMQTLFDEISVGKIKNELNAQEKVSEREQKANIGEEKELPDGISRIQGHKAKSSISRIVMFYDDNSFEEYLPRE